MKLEPDKGASGLLLRCPALGDIMGLLDGISSLREAYWLSIGGVPPNYSHTELLIDNGMMGSSGTHPFQKLLSPFRILASV